MPATTFNAIVQQQAQARPDKLAYRCGERRWTFADVERDTNRIAHALQAMGVGPGDRVAVLTKFHVESTLLTLAAAKLGAVCMPVNWRLAPGEVQYIVDHGMAKLMADTRNGQRRGFPDDVHDSVLRLLEQQLSEEDLFEPRQSKRRFVLCTTDYVECVLIPPLIQRLRKLAPGVTIEIRILRDTLPEAELASGEIDLVLGFDEYMQVPGYLGKETWLTEPLAGLVRATLELEEERITLAQLIDMPHVFHSPLGTSEASLDQFLNTRGLARTISVNSQSYMSAAAIVSQSDHLLVLPSMVAELLANHWPLKSLPLPADVPDYHLNCVWHPVHAQQPALIWLSGNCVWRPAKPCRSSRLSFPSMAGLLRRGFMPRIPRRASCPRSARSNCSSFPSIAAASTPASTKAPRFRPSMTR